MSNIFSSYRSRSLLALLAGALIAAAFLAPELFPLTWAALVPLFYAIRREEGWRRTFLLGWLAGMVAIVLGFYWLNYTIRVFGGFAVPVTLLVFSGFAFYASLPVAIFTVLVGRFGFGPLNLWPAIFWVTLEFWFPYLFPWQLASSQSNFLTLIQTADLVGPYGTSFLIVWVNATIFAALSSSADRRRALVRNVATLGLVLLLVLLYGIFALKSMDARLESAPKLSLAAVQGSIDIQYKWNTAFMESNLKSYLDLTEKADGARLIIWPESAVEDWIPETQKKLPPRLTPRMPPAASYLIFGARSFRGNPSSPDVKAFNSAFLIDRAGRVLNTYHKQVLLAFGEYIPLSRYLSSLPGLAFIGQGFTPGAGPQTLDIDANVKIAPLICYEDLMPFLTRDFVAQKGANVLVNLTNDAWFGNTVAPWQHARLALWRAIETRRALVRVTNTGVTTIIDAKGERLDYLPLFSSGVLRASVPLLEQRTLYVRFGDWFAWSSTLLTVFVLCRRRFLGAN
jgi:apolipoprotein N-acyltransferase